MVKPKLICPTHGRAGKIRVLDVVPDIALCVAASQAPLYAEAYPDAELVVHPDRVVGIAPKRQWIVDTFGEVIMFDDDVVGISDVSVAAGEKAQIKDPERIKAIVFAMFDLMEQLDAHVCGLSSYANPTMYRPQNPFSLKHMVSGDVMGIRPSSKIVWPPKRDLLNDDLYISALAMHHDRMVLTDLRHAVSIAKTWTATGGMQSHRTLQAMAEDEKYLKMVFGPEVIRRRQNSALSTVKNELQLQLSVPW